MKASHVLIATHHAVDTPVLLCPRAVYRSPTETEPDEDDLITVLQRRLDEESRG